MTPDYTDESTPATQPVQPAQPYVNQPLRPWLNGFLEIWTGKGRTLKANTTQWRKIASTGLLIWIVAHVISLFMYSRSEGVRADNMAMMQTSKITLSENDSKATEPNIQSLDFSITAAMQSGLIKAVQSWLPLTLLFWGSFALIGGGLTFGAAAGGVGYGMAVSAAGTFLTAALQSVTGSLRFVPGAGFLVSPGEYPWLFGFLTNINIFSMWQYAVLGLTLGYVARYRPKVGLAVGAFCYATMIAFMGAFSWLGQMIMK